MVEAVEGANNSIAAALLPVAWLVVHTARLIYYDVFISGLRHVL